MDGTQFASAASWAVPTLVLACLLAGAAAQIELRTSAPRQVVQSAGSPGPLGPSVAESSLAADAAVRVLLAWGASTSANSDQLRVLGLDPDQAPVKPIPVAGVRVAQVDPPGQGEGAYRVVLSAFVTGRSLYFAVPVRVVAGQASAVALPSSVPGPALGRVPQLGYAVRDVSVTSPMRVAVDGFLRAYLAGEDVTRWVSPGAFVPTVPGGAWPLVRVVGLDAASVSRERVEGPVPADGTDMSVLATFTVRVSKNASMTSQIPLEMTSRGGRWEVTSAAAAPLLDGPGEPVTEPGAEPSAAASPVGSPPAVPGAPTLSPSPSGASGPDTRSTSP